MIEKRPPKIEDPLELNEEAQSTTHFHDDILDDVEIDGADPKLDDDSAELTAAMLRKQKLNGALMTYGVGAAFFGIMVLLAYPHFKHYFVKPEPTTQQFAGVPLPPEARINHFAADTNPSGPAALGQAGQDVAAMRPATAGSPPSSSAVPSGAAQSGGDVSTATVSGTETAAASAPIMLPVPPSGNLPPVAPVASANGSTASGIPYSSKGDLPGASTEQVEGPATTAKLAEVDGKLASMQGKIDAMTAERDSGAGQLKQLQDSIDGLQKQVTELARVRQAPVEPRHNASAAASAEGNVEPTVARVHPHRQVASWELRSASPGTALIGHPGSNDLQSVAVGDMVSGLGRITSIQEQDGHWVVQASGGSVSQ